jgi:hypothetical protein
MLGGQGPMFRCLHGDYVCLQKEVGREMLNKKIKQKKCFFHVDLMSIT